MSKGSKRRPMKVSREVYESNWDKIHFASSLRPSGRVSSSEQELKVNEKCETTVGVLFHPEDPKLSKKKSVEIGGRPSGEPEPTRYGDWEKSGRCIDF